MTNSRCYLSLIFTAYLLQTIVSSLLYTVFGFQAVVIRHPNMGIRGLLSFLLQRKAECSKTVNLVSVAHKNGGIEILVDFYSFEHHFIKNLLRGLCALRNNDFLCILGAEYATVDAYVTKLVTDLKSLGIVLTFVIDGDKGASELQMKLKSDTWKQRQVTYIKRRQDVLRVCAGNMEVCDLSTEATFLPQLLEIQLRGTLRAAGCEVIQMAAGEADTLIAKLMKERKNAYAAMGNDSDFCAFQYCRLIPDVLFDLTGEIGIGESLELPKKPKRLLCGVITSQKVRELLQLTNSRSVIEVGILAGNDFTKSCMPTDLAFRAGVRNTWDIGNYAEWVRRYHRVENNNVIQEEIKRNETFANAVQYSRRFYRLEEQYEDEEESTDSTLAMIAGNIKRGEYSSSFLPMYKGYYIYKTILEDVEKFPSAEEMLAPFRAQLYAILLPRHRPTVTESRFTQDGVFEEMTVTAVNDTNIPTIDYLQINTSERLNVFHHILTHLERDRFSASNWFDIYGLKKGFVCYLLRYFLLLNWKRNLCVTKAEFKELSVVAFGSSNESCWQEIPVSPDKRCVSIAAVFQNIYRHAYHFLGTALHLTKEFPSPQNIFCGSMWTVLYVLCKPQQIDKFTDLKMYWAEQQRDAILCENYQIVQSLTRELYRLPNRHHNE